MYKDKKILSLKYRPQNFDDLIGQETIVKTIVNSIKFNRVPNAFLFTGIRGVGKTTIARIIAKALNCENGIDKLCKDKFCKNCESIINSNHLDVLELDAASRTGIDDIRELIEFSRYGPSSARYKIFIVDEVHMLSKQAFNGLLKTLEEPPSYLKFIFATTEIKKIPVTIVSRCQRFDLSRIKSNELLVFLKKVLKEEKDNINDDILKLIIKLSEGSVRDALSLLDRILISKIDIKDIDLKYAQNIFGYIDKTLIIEIFKSLFEGNEKKVFSYYEKIYENGIEPKVFLNDFLEILFYLKNINSLKMDSTNFSLNDNEFSEISALSKKIETKTLLMFWQFTINIINEINIVSNPNIALEMFLIRLLHLKNINSEDKTKEHEIKVSEQLEAQGIFNNDIENKNTNKNKTISQIKNIFQEEKIKPENFKTSAATKIVINNFQNLIDLSDKKKEIKLKYELETNVNLVSLEKNRIEISFNENLNKNFVKELSAKLYEWTGERWMISLTKKKGLETKKQVEKKRKAEFLNDLKKKEMYKKIIDEFPDAELIDAEEVND